MFRASRWVSHIPFPFHVFVHRSLRQQQATISQFVMENFVACFAGAVFGLSLEGYEGTLFCVATRYCTSSSKILHIAGQWANWAHLRIPASTTAREVRPYRVNEQPREWQILYHDRAHSWIKSRLEEGEERGGVKQSKRCRVGRDVFFITIYPSLAVACPSWSSFFVYINEQSKLYVVFNRPQGSCCFFNVGFWKQKHEPKVGLWKWKWGNHLKHTRPKHFADRTFANYKILQSMFAALLDGIATNDLKNRHFMLFHACSVVCTSSVICTKIACSVICTSQKQWVLMPKAWVRKFDHRASAQSFAS